eukprot:CAMPEP_0181245248 /NCGR_PEP_ID=MMETSP1096-20121128/43314_1 /TAXON_ID=156174 ORGANISM="Chrysochromulina ericina, Strain CCMP281" /NCGR_SAMPLE_ID=MMETSP1096 /ASSEMBLY_ACC=CAM_ASM_000453 /LENGTH=179 /DNA_ID=CAMNT_0023341895 /DNA_START=816 /DNA_END=1352 /DNA_ORIENTATION=+
MSKPLHAHPPQASYTAQPHREAWPPPCPTPSRMKAALPSNVMGLELQGNRLSGSLPSALTDLRNVRRCMLLTSQGSLQQRHPHRPADPTDVPNTNQFVCPTPRGLPAACAKGFWCVAKENGASAEALGVTGKGVGSSGGGVHVSGGGGVGVAEGGGGQPSSLSSEILKSNAQPWKLRLW